MFGFLHPPERVLGRQRPPGRAWGDLSNEILRKMPLDLSYLTHPEGGGFPRKGN